MKVASVASVVLVLLAGGFLFVRAQSAPSGTTHAISKVGVPITQLAKGGERELIVQKDATAPLQVEPPPGMTVLEWRTAHADYAMVVHVDTITPSLTPKADWIVSTVSAHVKQVLKNKDAAQINENDVVSFVQQGGEAALNGMHVRAVLPWADSFKIGNDYLIFASVTEDGQRLLVPEIGSFVISPKATLMPLAHAGKEREEMDVPLGIAAARIQSAAPLDR